MLQTCEGLGRGVAPGGQVDPGVVVGGGGAVRGRGSGARRWASVRIVMARGLATRGQSSVSCWNAEIKPPRASLQEPCASVKPCWWRLTVGLGQREPFSGGVGSDPSHIRDSNGWAVRHETQDGGRGKYPWGVLCCPSGLVIPDEERANG